MQHWPGNWAEDSRGTSRRAQGIARMMCSVAPDAARAYLLSAWRRELIERLARESVAAAGRRPS
jgi:hypothetical protein